MAGFQVSGRLPATALPSLEVYTHIIWLYANDFEENLIRYIGERVGSYVLPF
jgi:hypothetical protein